MAASSASEKSAASKIDYRGAIVGGAAGYEGKVLIGRASSESEARALVREKGYSSYTWDSVNGNVYAK